MLILCSRNTSLTLNCSRIQCRDYTKRNTETDTTAVRGCKTDTCANKDPDLVILWTGKQPTCRTCLEIPTFALFIFIFIFSCCWKFRHTKYAHIISINTSDFTFPQDGGEKNMILTVKWWTSLQNTQLYNKGKTTTASNMPFVNSLIIRW